MLSPAAARDKAASLVELARKQGRRRRRRRLCRRTVAGRQRSPRRAGGCPSQRGRGNRPSGVRRAAATRPSPRPTCRRMRWRRWSIGRWRWPPRRPRTNIAGLAPEETAVPRRAGRPRPRRWRRSRSRRAQGSERWPRKMRRASVEGVTNSNGASASASASIFAIATSHGFSGATRATGYSNSASVVAGEARRDAARLCLAFGPASGRSGGAGGDRRPRRRARGRASQSGQHQAGRDAGAVRPARRDHLARPFRRGDQRIGDCPPGELPARRARNPGLRARRHHP